MKQFTILQISTGKFIRENLFGSLMNKFQVYDLQVDYLIKNSLLFVLLINFFFEMIVIFKFTKIYY